MRPGTLLSILIGGAVGAGGILQGLKWRISATASTDLSQDTELAALQEEVELLRRENESLRSLAQGGGEFSVPALLVNFAQQAIGLDYKSSPVVHRVAPEELRGRVTASIESRFPPNTLDHRQVAWSLMGLLTPEDRFAPQMAVTRSLGARSWFDDQVGEGWVTTSFDEQSIPDQSALLRTLVRILLHQHYPPQPGYPGDEADRARTALHHGAAMAVENRYLARQALSIGFTGSTADDGGMADLLASLPVYVQGLATFPSEYGLPYARRLMDQEELLGALHKPPLSTAVFYTEENLEAQSPLQTPASSSEPVIHESAGMLGLRLWLATINPELTDAALAWRSDRYDLVAHSDVAMDLIWQIQLSNEKDAQTVLQAALAMCGAMADTETDPTPGTTVTSPDGRRLSAGMQEPYSVVFRNFAPE